MSKHILRLHVERPGTLFSTKNGDTTHSLGGHAWFEVVSPDNSSLQAGFGPENPKSEISSVPGTVSNDDGNRYHGPPAFTASYEVTASQANTLREFSRNPSQFGFDTSNYNAITNSCVDFVWKALEAIGMNPLKKEGDILPLDNIDDFMFLINLKMLKFPTSGDTSPWDMSWVRQAAAMSIEMNVWTREPEGTITVGPLGATPPTTASGPQGRPAAPSAVGNAQISSDMGSDFMPNTNSGLSFPSFIPPLFDLRPPSYLSCDRDHPSPWGR